MHYDEYLQRKVHADGYETAFTFGIPVFDGYGQFIFEYADGVRKINAVFLTILSRFIRVPFEVHAYIVHTVCTLSMIKKAATMLLANLYIRRKNQGYPPASSRARYSRHSLSTCS